MASDQRAAFDTAFPSAGSHGSNTQTGATPWYPDLDDSVASWIQVASAENYIATYDGLDCYAASTDDLGNAVAVGKLAPCYAQVDQQRSPIGQTGGGRAHFRLSYYGALWFKDWVADSLGGVWTTTQSPVFWACNDGTRVQSAIPLKYPVLSMSVQGLSGQAAPGTDFWRFNAFKVHIGDPYDAPVAAVLQPIGTYTATRVQAVWTYTQAQGVAPETWQVRVFTSAAAGSAGFDPDMWAAYYDSGERVGSDTSFNVPIDFAAGSYVAFVRVSAYMYLGGLSYQHVRFRGPWGKGSTFNMTTAPPAIGPPTIPTNIVTRLSAANFARLSQPHRPTFQAVLYWWDGSASWPLDLLDGSVTMDARNVIRGRCDLTVANRELVPSAAAPMSFERPLHPFGSYVHVSRGVGSELVSLGTFRIESVSMDRSGDATTPVKLSGADWSAHVADSRFTISLTRQTWSGGTPTPMWVSDVAQAIMAEARVAAYSWSINTGVAANYVNDRTTSRMDALVSLAKSLGWATYARANGSIYFGPSPDLTAAPRANLVEGDNATITGQSYTLSRDQVFDVAVAANDEGSIQASAYDQNPTSPIARSGSDTSQPWIGAGAFSPSMKPFFYASPVIVSLAGAQSAAVSTLSRAALPSDRITVTTSPLPDLQVGDMVTVRRVNANPDDPAVAFTIESLKVPLNISTQMELTLLGPATYIQAVNGT